VITSFLTCQYHSANIQYSASSLNYSEQRDGKEKSGDRPTKVMLLRKSRSMKQEHAFIVLFFKRGFFYSIRIINQDISFFLFLSGSTVIEQYVYKIMCNFTIPQHFKIVRILLIHLP